jgi:pre-mRNA-processing factor SLU7
MPPPKKPVDVSAAQKEKNEYIPSFISKKPFWIPEEDNTDYLEHQRLQKAANADKWYDRGKKGQAATKFRKGACENCGAMTHKTKECLSRPRKQGARWTNQDIQADEIIQDVDMGWDAKRDRWNGYDSREHKTVTEEFERMEALRREAKAAEDREKRLENGEEEDDTADKYAEESTMTSSASRNLRIREDTAKYLLNLDLDSAKYDPKTRSMVDSGVEADQAAALVAEDNLMKQSGEAADFEKAQKYAWEAQERGDKSKQHIQANPTEGEFFRKKQKEETEAKRAAHKKALMEKYGGDQHQLPASLRDMAVTENERYVEYSASGAIKGAPKAAAKSKYKEDVYIQNHTSVWGSWWSNFQWGYSCCHSMVKNSYCTGEEGIKGDEEAKQMRTGGVLEEELDTKKDIEWAKPAIPDHREEDIQAEAASLEAAKSAVKKRTLDEMKSGVSEEDLEAYKRKRTMAEDPMAGMLGKDEILDYK